MNRQPTDNQYERELVYRLKQGDHDAFEQIYHIYKDRLIGNLLRILKSRELVEEQVQDLFLNIWKGRDQIDCEKPFKAYLFAIAVNMAKNVIRRAYYDKRMRAALQPIEQRIYMHVEEHICSAENKQILNSLLDKLPPQRRTVFTLCKLEGKSYKEVSELLHISENTVNDHIRKANLTLRQLHNSADSIGFLFAIYLGNQIF
ncbi:RNA polymerase sigma-70 factor [Sphingobacterium psychroaquaticum]|uniref:RNA polymerase sigma factor n=1 Tax=Sphingobacterium psychroaquaticum TaxID=561061 RepID=UPI0010698B44|nr:RNA polymerase sigma-70 factor [Sphingobacterium psychroaquaticum]QBQ40631.1 RNA polymerase sigma-70 factor [Sphingobacterium psychroaquaticum]